MSIITTRELTRVFKQGDSVIYAVNEVDIDISKGEFIVIIGQSGSGKSTLLNLIGCIDKPTKGFIEIDNADITKMNDKELSRVRRQKIGYIYQQFNLIPILTARENIIMPLLLDKKKADENYFMQLAKLVNIEDKMDCLPHELSGGQQQRVAIARALINKPAIILADEPTGSLDTKTANDIINLLIEINKQGNTVLLVTHNEEYVRLSDRVFVMRDGKLETSVNRSFVRITNAT